MATTLRSTVHARLGWTWRDQLESGMLSDSRCVQLKVDLADGSQTGQADAVWYREGVALGQGQSLQWDLDGLPQTLFGYTVTIGFARVKAFLVVHRGAGPGWLLIGGADCREWSEPFGAPGDTLRAMPDSPLLLAHCREGWAVDAEHAALRLGAVCGPVTFDIALLGTLTGHS